MSVDDEATQTGTTEGRHVGLELLEPLYVGGVPDGTTLNGQANFTRGFRGCISRLVIKDSITELMRVAEEKVCVIGSDTKHGWSRLIIYDLVAKFRLTRIGIRTPQSSYFSAIQTFSLKFHSFDVLIQYTVNDCS